MILEQFQKAEEAPPHRNGTFKIDVPFEKAVEVILKARHQTKPKSTQNK